MTVFRSVPALILLVVTSMSALVSLSGRHARAAAWISVCCASALTAVTLVEGGTMYEALVCLLLPVWLLMAKENTP